MCENIRVQSRHEEWAGSSNRTKEVHHRDKKKGVSSIEEMYPLATLRTRSHNLKQSYWNGLIAFGVQKRYRGLSETRRSNVQQLAAGWQSLLDTIAHI